MKTMILTTFVMLTTTIAQASSIKSEELTIRPSSVDKVVRLVDKPDPGSSHKKLSIISSDNGLSTDMSPRYTIYLGYQSAAEMGNINANFELSKAYSLESAKRIAGGVYEVVTTEYRDEQGFVKVTQRVDATKMFSDEKAAREACGDDFCDLELKTSIEVKEISAVKIKK